MPFTSIDRGLIDARLSRRLTTMAAVTTAAAIVLPCALITAWDLSERRQTFEDRARVMVTALGEMSAVSLASADAAAARTALETIARSDRRIVRAAVRRDDGSTLATFGPGAAADFAAAPAGRLDPTATWTESRGGRSLMAGTPVMRANAEVGSVMVEFSRDDYRSTPAAS